MIKESICILLLILYPATAASPLPPQQQREVTMQSWLQCVKTTAERYGVDPYFALAVAETESSGDGRQFRFGKIGRGTYYGPFGIHRCFLKKWNIADPYVNTEVGIRALSRYPGNQRKSLKKYNASFNEAYWKRIKKLEARNRKKGVFK